MVDTDAVENRQQTLYWKELVQLRIGAAFIRLYRDYMGQWVTRIGMVKAIASSSSIAAWAVWHQYAFLWGMIIALSQVIDALKEVFPVTKQFRAASEHTIALDRIFINAQLEFENVRSGKFTDDQIMKRIHVLRKLRHDAQVRSFKEGWPIRKDMFSAAEADANMFFKATYNVDLSAAQDPKSPATIPD